MGMQPLQDWALIEPSEAKGKTTGGVVHPRHGKGEARRRKSLGCGEGEMGDAGGQTG